MQEIITELTQQDPILRELIAREPVPCIQSTKQVLTHTGVSRCDELFDRATNTLPIDQTYF
jgi:hypothetical protein